MGNLLQELQDDATRSLRETEQLLDAWAAFERSPDGHRILSPFIRHEEAFEQLCGNLDDYSRQVSKLLRRGHALPPDGSWSLEPRYRNVFVREYHKRLRVRVAAEPSNRSVTIFCHGEDAFIPNFAIPRSKLVDDGTFRIDWFVPDGRSKAPRLLEQSYIHLTLINDDFYSDHCRWLLFP